MSRATGEKVPRDPTRKRTSRARLKAAWETPSPSAVLMIDYFSHLKESRANSIRSVQSLSQAINLIFAQEMYLKSKKRKINN